MLLGPGPVTTPELYNNLPSIRTLRHLLQRKARWSELSERFWSDKFFYWTVWSNRRRYCFSGLILFITATFVNHWPIAICLSLSLVHCWTFSKSSMIYRNVALFVLTSKRLTGLVVMIKTKKDHVYLYWLFMFGVKLF